MSDVAHTLNAIIDLVFRRHPELVGPFVDRVMPGFTEWHNRGYSVPCPRPIKNSVLRRYSLPEATWIETGTYLGDTTQFLSQLSSKVISLEPDFALYEKAKARFRDNQKVVVINSTSEETLPNLLGSLSGDICLWLDGHYSGDGTFKGPNDTPLVAELKCIGENIDSFNRVVVCIDDIRLCGKRHSYGSYPSLNHLIDWSNQHRMLWSIEYDIFVAHK